MKAPNRKLSVGWYLEPPFSDPRQPSYFQTQNWWLDDEVRKPISKQAIDYELARRHPSVGEMLCGWRNPEGIVDRFLFYHARIAWPWLPAEFREEWQSLAQPQKSRADHRLQIISNFEATELGRFWDFEIASKGKAVATVDNSEKAVRNFNRQKYLAQKLGDKQEVKQAVKWKSQKLKIEKPHKDNEAQRRGLRLACNRCLIHLTLDN